MLYTVVAYIVMATITLIGQNFATSDPTLTAHLSNAHCKCSEWKSETSMVCILPTIASLEDTVQLTVSRLVGTGSDRFSFDAPAVSAVSANLALSGGGSVTVLGLGFAPGEYSQTAAIAAAVCSSTSWVTATTLVCAPAAASVPAPSTVPHNHRPRRDGASAVQLRRAGGVVGGAQRPADGWDIRLGAWPQFGVQ